NLKRIAKEEFASSPHHPINVRKRIHESENHLRFAKHVKLAHQYRYYPAVVFDHFLSEFKQLYIINDKYRFILPDDAKIWFENSWESHTNDLTSPNLNKLKYNKRDEIFFLQILCNISITKILEKTWLTDTIHQFLEAAVRDISGLTCATLLKHLRNKENCKPDRTVRLKLEDNQFEILYVEDANPELKGKKCQEDAE
ncbi:3033_t:CDS:2, partial [Racocetra persica]